MVSMIAAEQRSAGVHVAAVLQPHEAVDHPFIMGLRAADIPVTTIEVGRKRYYKEYSALRRIISRLSPSIVHTHGYRADLVAGFAARRSRVPVVSTVHGFTGGDWRNRVNERLQLLALRRCSATIAVSRPLVERLTAEGVTPTRIHLVPNAIATPMSLSREEARRKLGLSEAGFVVGWVGRLSREKGLDVMLKALALSDPDSHLSIIGEGPERSSLRRLADEEGIASRVKFHGEVANAASLMNAFDTLVISSRTEGTPISLLEAMALGVPIVATKVGGIPDVVSDSEAIIVPAEDPRAIAAALSEMRSNPSAARKRAGAARSRVHSAYGVRRWMADIGAAYESVLGTRL